MYHREYCDCHKYWFSVTLKHYYSGLFSATYVFVTHTNTSLAHSVQKNMKTIIHLLLMVSLVIGTVQHKLKQHITQPRL